jgi:TatD DNase family protein
MDLTDTHCHIHEMVADGRLTTETSTRWQKSKKVGTPDEVIAAAHQAGVTRLVCVGTTLADSKIAVDFVQNRQNTWASIGIHPHEAKDHVNNPAMLKEFETLAARNKVVAVGECGLDYFYTHSSKEDQIRILRFQIEVALKHDLPMIFHVRDAFDDFWPIFDEYEGIRGIIHSFTATEKELQQILDRGLFVGINGIMTFTKDPRQLAAAKAVPIEKLVLETDAPFLTPAPYRGTICEPKHVRVTAEFLANLRGESVGALAAQTTSNAQRALNLR